MVNISLVMIFSKTIMLTNVKLAMQADDNLNNLITVTHFKGAFTRCDKNMPPCVKIALCKTGLLRHAIVARKLDDFNFPAKACNSRMSHK